MSAPENPHTDQEPSDPDSSDASDGDSAYDPGRSRGLSTTSVESYIRNYHEEFGRTYHRYGGGQYHFPNDGKEIDRLDLQNVVFLELFDGELFLAPISGPHEVLDVGAGSGIWAIDFADEYPGAVVIGTDLSLTQPDWVPPNCEFVIEDANDTWYCASDFDFIHCRQLHMAVKEKRLFRQSFDALKPGGWLAIQEVALPLFCPDRTLEGTALAKWQDNMMEASRISDTPFDNPHHYGRWMKEAGFVNVQQFVCHIPMNGWPQDPKMKRVGR